MAPQYRSESVNIDDWELLDKEETKMPENPPRGTKRGFLGFLGIKGKKKAPTTANINTRVTYNLQVPGQ